MNKNRNNLLIIILIIMIFILTSLLLMRIFGIENEEIIKDLGLTPEVHEEIESEEKINIFSRK